MFKGICDESFESRAKGQVKAKGPVNKILKIVPLTKPLFPIYKDLTADKDAAAA